jgi:excisionase family DNA binding protein
MESVLVTPEEAAKALGIGRCTLYDLLRTHQIESCKIGKSRRIPVHAVHEFARRMVEQEGNAA